MFWTDEILASNKGGVLDSATEYFRCFTPGDGASWDVYSDSPACSLRDDGQRERIRRRELLLRQRRGRLCFCLDATWSRAWRFDRGHDHGGIWSSAIDDKRSEEHTSELQSLMRISYAVFCLKKKTSKNNMHSYIL